jgi:alpha-1,4-digalacturonate transport system substrate-binding protein
MTATHILSGAAVALALAGAAGAQELRFSCYQDGVECEAWSEQLKTFEAENAGITVAVEIVPYQSITEGLPVQLAVGEGPDLARVTDFGGLAPYLLDVREHVSDPEAIEARYGPSLAWARVGENSPEGIYNIVDQLTLTGGFANRTLFEQAGVEMPAPGSTWEQWAEASREVRDATGVDFAMAIDRTGHRFAAPAISYGAAYFDEAGEPIVVDEGFRAFAEQFLAWHEDETMAGDVWAGAGAGPTRTPPRVHQREPRVLLLRLLADRALRPRHRRRLRLGGHRPGLRPRRLHGVPGGAGIVGLKHTQHPEAVGKVLDFMARDDVQAAVLAMTKNLPPTPTCRSRGSSTRRAAAGDGGARRLRGLHRRHQPSAFALQGYRNNRAIYTATPARITQAIVGELTLDEALERLDADVAEAVAASEVAARRGRPRPPWAWLYAAAFNLAERPMLALQRLVGRATSPGCSWRRT